MTLTKEKNMKTTNLLLTTILALGISFSLTSASLAQIDDDLGYNPEVKVDDDPEDNDVYSDGSIKSSRKKAVEEGDDNPIDIGDDEDPEKVAERWHDQQMKKLNEETAGLDAPYQQPKATPKKSTGFVDSIRKTGASAFDAFAGAHKAVRKWLINLTK